MKTRKIISLLILFSAWNISAQSQITWLAGTNVAASSYSNMHPRIVVDGSGNPLVIWGRMSDESVFFSRWDGNAFTTPLKLNPSTLTIATASWMGPDIASHGDTVYVVMKATPEAYQTSHIYIVYSYDGGVTFSSPVQVDFIADSLSRFPTVTTDQSGNPIVGFMKFNSSFADSRWAVATSSDLGNTFSADVKASGWSGAGALVCDCCPGSITCAGSTVAMFYRDNLTNIRDTWVGISDDDGASFSDGWGVDDNNWMLMSCPASGPDGVIVGDSLYSVFMNGASGINRVYRSSSSISDGTSQATESLTGNIGGLGLQNYPRIDKSGSAVAIVWKQNVSGQDQLPILFTSDISDGFPATYDTVDLSNISNADVALFDGNVFVVWEDDNSGTVKYRSGTYTPISTSISEVNSMATIVYPNPASDFVNVTLSEKMNDVSVSVRDVLGNELDVPYQLESQALRFDFSLLNSGTYFLHLVGKDFSQTQKLIVER